jgi:hypothetical protein
MLIYDVIESIMFKVVFRNPLKKVSKDCEKIISELKASQIEERDKKICATLECIVPDDADVMKNGRQ